MLVSGLPYEVVWATAIRALGERYPLAQAGEGVIVTERVERAPRPGEAAAGAAVDRVAERVTLWVEPVGERLTQLSVRIDAEGRRDGAWVPLPAGEDAAQAILAGIRDAPRAP
jgi:hypothetical protein